ncbi:MAG: CHRD domain-containing protein [Gammaproteobacteria bacterium]
MSSTTATVARKQALHTPLARKMLGIGAALIIASALGAAGCSSGEVPPDSPPPSNPPPNQPNTRDAATADLQNMAFSFPNGAAFDAALAGQPTTLDIGAFDASNTAPVRLESNQLTANGVATLNSPLTLDFRVVPAGLPFSGAPISLEARLDDNNVLSLDNAGTVSTASATGVTSAVAPVIFPAQLSGSQEAPTPVITPASGTAAIAPSPDGTSLAFQLEYTMLVGVQQAHLHLGVPGENGGIIFFLCATDQAAPAQAPAGTPACPAPDTPMSGTLTASEFMAIIGAVDTFEEAVAAVAAGNVYVNVHTGANPGGELRGQVGPATLQVGLSGTQEVPAVATAATGAGSVTLNATQTQISYSVDYAVIEDIQQAHLHVGIAGTNGSPLFFLCATNPANPVPVPAGTTPQACPAAPGPLTGTLTTADFTSASGVATFDAAVSRLLSGETYVNIHSLANPGGELRGQLGPATVQAPTLADVVVAGTGSAAARLNAAQSAITYTLSYADIVAAGASIRIGDANVDAGVVLFALCGAGSGVVCPAAADTPLTGTLITDAAGADSLVHAPAFAAVLDGVNNIRDQIEGPTVSFAAQVQPIFDANCIGCHGASGGMSLEQGVSHGNIVDVASGARVRIASRDPANSFLIQRIEAGSLVPMPPGGALGNANPQAVELIKRWTAEGAPNN